VTTKEDLLDLAVDHIIDEVPVPDPGLDPRSALRALLVGWRAAMLARPWSLGLLGRPLLGPNVQARTEFLHAAPTRAGLTGVDLASAARLLANFVIGTAMADATWRKLDDPAVVAKAQAHVTGLRELYPTLSASNFVDRKWSDDDLFRHGLERALDAALPPPGVGARRVIRTLPPLVSVRLAAHRSTTPGVDQARAQRSSMIRRRAASESCMSKVPSARAVASASTIACPFETLRVASRMRSIPAPAAVTAFCGGVPRGVRAPALMASVMVTPSKPSR
jgi:hypothetical protein